VDDDFKQRMVEEFAEALGSPEAVRDSINLAMSHSAVLKHSDHQAYLRNWLRENAERRRQRLTSTGPRSNGSRPVSDAGASKFSRPKAQMVSHV